MSRISGMIKYDEIVLQLARSNTPGDFMKVFKPFLDLIGQDWRGRIPIGAFVRTRDQIRDALGGFLSGDGVGSLYEQRMQDALIFAVGFHGLKMKKDLDEGVYHIYPDIRTLAEESVEGIDPVDLQRNYIYFCLAMAVSDPNFKKRLRLCPQCANFFLYHPKTARGACCSKKCSHALAMKKYQRKRRARAKMHNKEEGK